MADYDGLCKWCEYAVWEEPPKEFRYWLRPVVANCKLGLSPFWDETQECQDCIGYEMYVKET